MSELSALAQHVAAATRTVSETVDRPAAVSPLALFRAADHDAEVLLKCEHQHQLVEGSATVAIAAGLQAARSRPGQTTAVVACGANISSDALATAVVPAAGGT